MRIISPHTFPGDYRFFTKPYSKPYHMVMPSGKFDKFSKKVPCIGTPECPMPNDTPTRHSVVSYQAGVIRRETNELCILGFGWSLISKLGKQNLFNADVIIRVENKFDYLVYWRETNCLTIQDENRIEAALPEFISFLEQQPSFDKIDNITQSLCFM